MKTHNSAKHPGPWLVMRVDSGLAGVLIAAGFVLMAFVSMPIAAWFVGGAILIGVLVALLLRTIGKN